MVAQALPLNTAWPPVVELVVPAATYTSGQVIQLHDGRAGVVTGLRACATGDTIEVAVAGRYVIAKTTSVVILRGGRVFWHPLTSLAHFAKQNDRDFYLGTAANDAASADTTLVVDLNVRQWETLDMTRDPGTTATVGTAAAEGFGRPKRIGGSTKFLLTATNEAQKVDILGVESIVASGKPIIEVRVNNITNGSGGSQDFNIGLASGTNATDADSITKYVFLHIDGNSLATNIQSKDGTTTVAATTLASALVAGTPFEVWIDCRDLTNVKVYKDGVRVASGTTIDISQMGSTALSLLAHLEKTSSTDTFEIDVDRAIVRTMQQTA